MSPTPPPTPPMAASDPAVAETKSSVPLALISGLAASLVGAVVWAAVTVTTEMQIGWMAVGVGFLVGFAVGRFNYSGKALFGGIGATLALFGCLLGNLFSLLGFVGKNENIALGEVMSVVDWSRVPGAMAESFSAMDLLFYGIAIYQGYKFGVRPRQS